MQVCDFLIISCFFFHSMEILSHDITDSSQCSFELQSSHVKQELFFPWIRKPDLKLINKHAEPGTSHGLCFGMDCRPVGKFRYFTSVSSQVGLCSVLVFFKRKYSLYSLCLIRQQTPIGCRRESGCYFKAAWKLTWDLLSIVRWLTDYSSHKPTQPIASH